MNQKALFICDQALKNQTQYAEQTGAALAGPAALIHLASTTQPKPPVSRVG